MVRVVWRRVAKLTYIIIMYSKEETKQMRMDFWDGFRKYSTPKRRKAGKNRDWMLQKTGIKTIHLKFNLNNEKALVGIEIFHRDKYIEGLYYEKFECLRGILRNAFGDSLIWQPDYISEEGRQMALIYVEKTHTSIHRKESWEDIYSFFCENMMKFEELFVEYKEFIKDI